MGLGSALKRIIGKRETRSSAIDDTYFGPGLWSNPSISGVRVDQQTAMTATTVMACVTILAEDFAKLTPNIFHKDPTTGARKPATDHDLYVLLYQPNDFQNGFEFRETMMANLVLHGNAYAVKIRDGRGRVLKLVPVNANWVALREAPDGNLFYRVTPTGLHMMAELKGEPFFIPSDDMLHIRGMSMNGLLGSSRMMMAKEAIALSLAYEQQASRWMNNQASLSGVLQTDQKLSEPAAKRLAQDWRDLKTGLQNAGKIAVLEQGLKFQPLSMNAEQAQFIASRQFQVAEVARAFRVPLHMMGDLTRSTDNNISQQAQEYINLTLSGYVSRWREKLDVSFDLRAQDLFVDFDLSQLIRGDVTTRYANYARGITGGFLTMNEARIDDGRDPMPGGDELLKPLNMDAPGSHSTGAKAEGGGRPSNTDAGKGPTAQ